MTITGATYNQLNIYFIYYAATNMKHDYISGMLMYFFILSLTT